MEKDSSNEGAQGMYKAFVEDAEEGSAQGASKPQVFNVYDAVKMRKDKAPKAASKPKKAKVVDMNKSYESMGSEEAEQPHYNYDSDGEPPTDEVGDKLTIVKKQQVVKTILEVGA